MRADEEREADMDALFAMNSLVRNVCPVLVEVASLKSCCAARAKRGAMSWRQERMRARCTVPQDVGKMYEALNKARLTLSVPSGPRGGRRGRPSPNILCLTFCALQARRRPAASALRVEEAAAAISALPPSTLCLTHERPRDEWLRRVA